VSALWIVDARDGSAPVQLTACPGSICNEYGAAWSADGKRIAFVTTGADEQAQIVSADAAGGNITTAYPGARSGEHAAVLFPTASASHFLYSQGARSSPDR